MSNIELRALREMESKIQKNRSHLEHIVYGDFLGQVIRGDRETVEECKKHDPKEALEIIRKWQTKRKGLLKKADIQTNNCIEYAKQLGQLDCDLGTLKQRIYLIEMRMEKNNG